MWLSMNITMMMMMIGMMMMMIITHFVYISGWIWFIIRKGYDNFKIQWSRQGKAKREQTSNWKIIICPLSSTLCTYVWYYYDIPWTWSKDTLDKLYQKYWDTIFVFHRIMKDQLVDGPMVTMKMMMMMTLKEGWKTGWWVQWYFNE